MNSLQLQFLMLIFAGSVNRGQQEVIEYLHEENRVLREHLGGKQLLFTDRQRRRLASKAKAIGRRGLFVIDLQTRRIEIVGIVHQPDGEWMKQIARNLTDSDAEFLNGARYLIHDRDPLFTEGFGKILKPSGVKTVKLPARSTNSNAYAERFVRSVKTECLAKIIPRVEGHLRKAGKEFTEHYHLERNHQGLDNELIEKLIDGPNRDGTVDCRERLGGVLRYYYRTAA